MATYTPITVAINRRRKKLLLFVGIIFPISLFLSLFYVLNFFNIIRLDSISSFFSFLPYKSSSALSDVYATNKPNATLNRFVKDTVNMQYIPSIGHYTQVNNLFWYTSNATYNGAPILSAEFKLDNQNNVTDELYVRYLVVNPSINSQTANALVKQYFILPMAQTLAWKCLSFRCDSMIKLNKAKIGYSLFTNMGSNPNMYILTCYIPKESRLYAYQSTCF